MVYCQKCGTKNVDDANFCVNCGTEITREDKNNEKQQIRESAPKQSIPPSQESKPLPRPFSLRAPFIIAIIIAVAIISSIVIVLVAHPFDNDGNGDGDSNDVTPNGNSFTLSVQEFHDTLSIYIDSENYTCYRDVAVADNGDIVKIVGKIDKLVGNYDEDIGEYTSIVLYNANGSDLLVHCLGNVSNKYSMGDYVVITLHITDRYGLCSDLYGTQWFLSGEFLSEEFVNGKIAFDLIIPQNQMKKL